MLCFQVTAQFAFYNKKPALVSTHIKQQDAAEMLVTSCLPFLYRLKLSRWFHTQEEAAQFTAYVQNNYKDRTFPALAVLDGQQLLFQEDE